jgi:thiol-disulfide isomerase/thioredoxin
MLLIRYFRDDVRRPTRRLSLALPIGVAAAVAVVLVGVYLSLRPASVGLGPWGTDVAFAHLTSPRATPPLYFHDAAGKRLTLADFRGKVILLNVWATWCLPCRREMPALDRLQRTLGGPHFQVIALSIDSGGVPAVKRYFNTLGLHALEVYVDPTMRAANALDITGTPTTFLIDRSGREIGGYLGPAKWDSQGTERFLRSVVAPSTQAAGP